MRKIFLAFSIVLVGLIFLSRLFYLQVYNNNSNSFLEDNAIKIVVDKKSLLYLVGTTLEFSGGLNGKGFVFVNPNANRTCGCGESFSL